MFYKYPFTISILHLFVEMTRRVVLLLGRIYTKKARQQPSLVRKKLGDEIEEFLGVDIAS
jgi:hypothetical protein